MQDKGNRSCCTGGFLFPFFCSVIGVFQAVLDMQRKKLWGYRFIHLHLGLLDFDFFRFKLTLWRLHKSKNWLFVGFILPFVAFCRFSFMFLL